MKVIGISAHAARSGKDTLAKCLQIVLAERGKNVAIRSLATPLKERTRAFILEEFQIDVNNCNDEEKAIIRPLLVAYGGARRKQTKGRFWTGLMDIELSRLKKENVDYVIVPDVRYCEYPGDEGDWMKNKGGALFFVSLILEDGKRLDPPNEDEARNGPLLEEIADIKVQWPHMEFDDCLHFVRKNFDKYSGCL